MSNDPVENMQNFRDFKKMVILMETEPACERFVRGVLERSVHSCPVSVAKRLAEVVIAVREEDYRKEAGSN